MDLATATKSHLVHHWGELADAATRRGRRIRISAATGAALPAADIAKVSLRGFDCRAIRACPNCTSTFVLDLVAGGQTLSDAVARAQALGIAETDPSADLDGLDAAAKIVLLANVLWDLRTRVEDVARDPIDDSLVERTERAMRRGARIRAVASADRASKVLVVRLEETPPSDPLHQLVGPEKAVQFDCGPQGEILVSGGKSSPTAAAHALLKDALDLAVGGVAPGFG